MVDLWFLVVNEWCSNSSMFMLEKRASYLSEIFLPNIEETMAISTLKN